MLNRELTFKDMWERCKELCGIKSAKPRQIFEEEKIEQQNCDYAKVSVLAETLNEKSYKEGLYKEGISAYENYLCEVLIGNYLNGLTF